MHPLARASSFVKSIEREKPSRPSELLRAVLEGARNPMRDEFLPRFLPGFSKGSARTGSKLLTLGRQDCTRLWIGMKQLVPNYPRDAGMAGLDGRFGLTKRAISRGNERPVWQPQGTFLIRVIIHRRIHKLKLAFQAIFFIRYLEWQKSLM